MIDKLRELFPTVPKALEHAIQEKPIVTVEMPAVTISQVHWYITSDNNLSYRWDIIES